MLEAQRHDGVFELNVPKSKLVSVGFHEEYLAALSGALGASVSHTAAALAALRICHARSRDVWSLLASKSEVWFLSLFFVSPVERFTPNLDQGRA